MRQRLGPDAALIGVGGVDSAETAAEKIRAGADLVQTYTGMIYAGPTLPGRIVEGLSAILDREASLWPVAPLDHAAVGGDEIGAQRRGSPVDADQCRRQWRLLKTAHRRPSERRRGGRATANRLRDHPFVLGASGARCVWTLGGHAGYRFVRHQFDVVDRIGE